MTSQCEDLSSLLVSGNHDIYNSIYKLTIQLDECTTKEKIEQILVQSQAVLDNHIDFLLAKELFSLILKCYSLLTNDCVPFFSQLLNKYRNNVNYTIITASVLSFLIHENIHSQLPEYDFFINDCINELIPQTENENQIVIFQNEIPQMFKLNFILDVVLSSKLTDQIIKSLVKYLFVQNDQNFFYSNNVKLTQIIHDIISADKVDLITNFMPKCIKLYLNLSIDDLAIIIPFFPKQGFKYILPKLEEIFLCSSEINTPFVLAFLNKCIEFNIKLKSIDRAFNFLSAKDLSSQIITYSYRYNFNLPIEVAKKFVDLQDFQFVLKVIPSLLIIPKQKIENVLLEKNDLNFYKLLFTFGGVSSQVLTTSNFYVHIIMTLIEFKKELTTSFIQNFANYFQQNIKEEEFTKIMDEIIFSFCFSNQDTLEVLFNFINSLDNSYLNLFYETHHMKMLIMKILGMEVVPSHLFIQLINKEDIYGIISNLILLNKRVNSRLYYIYYFSKEINHSIFNDRNQKIFNNEFDYKIRLNIFPSSKKHSNQLIRFINENNYDLLHLLDDESLSFVMNSLIFSQNKSHTITGLTDETILPFYAIVLRNLKSDINFNPFINPNTTCLFLNTLKQKLNDDSPIVIASINSILQSAENQVTIYNFDELKIEMIEIFIESILNDQCKEFESRLVSYISSNINCLKYIKSSINDFVQYLFSKNEKYYLTIERILERYQFFKNSHHIIKIPIKFCEQNEIPNLIPMFEYIASNCDIEDDDFFIKYLFRKMMSDKDLRKGHLLIRLQSQTNEHLISREHSDSFIINDYLDYVSDIKSTSRYVYQYNSKIGMYVKKPHFVYDDIFNSEFKLGMSIIDMLLNYIKRNQYCYQAFICLRSIASSFIFLFEKDPNQIFEIILPKIENISIIYTKILNDPNGEIENKAKTSLTAYSFLIATLNSSKILDSFINCFFTNIERFTDIQILCLNNIFYTILNTEKLNLVLMASLIKHNYIDTIQKFMSKNIPKGVFRDNYMSILRKLIFVYYDCIQKFDSHDAIVIDELKNIKSPFYHEFNHYTIIQPFKQYINQIINIPKTKLNKKILFSVSKIERVRYFSFRYNVNENSICSYEQNSEEFIFDKDKELLNEIPSITVKMLRYVYKKASWIYNWMMNDNENYPFSKDYYAILNQTISEIKEIDQNHQNDELVNDFDIEKYFENQFNQEGIIKYLIENMLTLSLIDFQKACKLISLFLNRKNDKISILKSLVVIFDKINENALNGNISEYLSRILSVLQEISNNEVFKDNFVDIFETKLVDMILEYKNRWNNEILIKFTNIMMIINLESYLYKTFFIFQLIYSTENEELLFKTAKFFSIYDIEIYNNHIDKIKKLFKDEIEKNELDFSKIIEFINLPSLKESKEITILLDKLFTGIRNNDDNKKEMIKLINLLTPVRTIFDSNIFIHNDKVIQEDPPVPSLIFESNPVFWNYFNDKRDFINNIIENNNLTLFNDEYDADKDNSEISLRLFDQYTELYSFSFRYKLFFKSINRKIKSSPTVQLEIDRDHIIESSFDQLNFEDYEYWKSIIRITYKNDEGYDLGGLLRDWFTKLSRELFNPDLGLFKLSDKMNYQPSVLSYGTPDHLALFKFTGAIIGRAIMQGITIDAHLTRPFLNNILDRETVLSDIEDFDEAIFKSLNDIFNHDIDSDSYIPLYFEVDHPSFDKIETYELVENGSEKKLLMKISQNMFNI